MISAVTPYKSPMFTSVKIDHESTGTLAMALASMDEFNSQNREPFMSAVLKSNEHTQGLKSCLDLSGRAQMVAWDIVPTLADCQKFGPATESVEPLALLVNAMIRTLPDGQEKQDVEAVKETYHLTLPGTIQKKLFDAVDKLKGSVSLETLLEMVQKNTEAIAGLRKDLDALRQGFDRSI